MTGPRSERQSFCKKTNNLTQDLEKWDFGIKRGTSAGTPAPLKRGQWLHRPLCHESARPMTASDCYGIMVTRANRFCHRNGVKLNPNANANAVPNINANSVSKRMLNLSYIPEPSGEWRSHINARKTRCDPPPLKPFCSCSRDNLPRAQVC